MQELRAQGALDWLISAGYVNATMRDWLAWYDYLEATQRESGVRGSRDRTLTYFTDLYAVMGGVYYMRLIKLGYKAVEYVDIYRLLKYGIVVFVVLFVPLDYPRYVSVSSGKYWRSSLFFCVLGCVRKWRKRRKRRE